MLKSTNLSMLQINRGQQVWDEHYMLNVMADKMCYSCMGKPPMFACKMTELWILHKLFLVRPMHLRDRWKWRMSVFVSKGVGFCLLPGARVSVFVSKGVGFCYLGMGVCARRGIWGLITCVCVWVSAKVYVRYLVFDCLCLCVSKGIGICLLSGVWVAQSVWE